MLASNAFERFAPKTAIRLTQPTAPNRKCRTGPLPGKERFLVAGQRQRGI
jgi:hypothetical protein